jgi:ABC-type nitrate/sulfonate/bicarbonate transport system permease component
MSRAWIEKAAVLRGQVAPASRASAASGVAAAAAAALLRVAAAETPAGSFGVCFIAAATVPAAHARAGLAVGGAFGVGLDHGARLAPRLLPHRATATGSPQTQ